MVSVVGEGGGGVGGSIGTISHVTTTEVMLSLL